MGYIYIQDRSGKKHLQEYIYMLQYYKKEKKNRKEKRREEIDPCNEHLLFYYI